MIQLTNLPDQGKAFVQTLDDVLLRKSQVGIDVLRLDKIHTIISGNKWFKLKYYLDDALKQRRKGIVTFGGPYSNHLIASAYASRIAGLHSIGIVRGERPKSFSQTLSDIESYGMTLKFASRDDYGNEHFKTTIKALYPDHLLVEEGGRGRAGIRGAEEILHLTAFDQYSHIICAVGTGTMMTGIVNSSLPHQTVIGIPVLKFDQSNSNTVADFVTLNASSENFAFQYDFHFEGYAKKNKGLLGFMSDFYKRHGIPTDFVYTGKLFYGVMKLVGDGFFNPDSKILIIHSGGLQGNRSLPEGQLQFSE